MRRRGADFTGLRAACGEPLFADPPDLPILAVAEPPGAAANEGENDKAGGEGAEDFVLPELARPLRLGEFTAKTLDLELEVGVADGGVVKVALFLQSAAVGELQSAAPGLVGRRLGVRGIARKVETGQRSVAGAGVSCEEEPRLFLLLAGIEELELGVGDPTIIGIHYGRLRPVALADDLDEALAGVDLVAQDLAEVALLGAEDFLKGGRVAQPCKDGSDATAYLAKLRRDAGDKDDDWLIEQLAPIPIDHMKEYVVFQDFPESEAEVNSCKLASPKRCKKASVVAKRSGGRNR